MKELILYFITFIFIYLFYIIFVLNRKSILKKFPKGKEMTYLRYKYNIKVNESNIKKIANSVFLANSFILSTAVYIVSLLDNFILKILVGFITLVILILVLYHFIGMHYRNRR